MLQQGHDNRDLARRTMLILSCQHVLTAVHAPQPPPRFSAVCAVPRHEIQLLGVTCLWVAAKFDRVHTPPARFFAAMTSGLCRCDPV